MRYAILVLALSACVNPTAAVEDFPDCPPGEYATLFDDPAAGIHRYACMSEAAAAAEVARLLDG